MVLGGKVNLFRMGKGSPLTQRLSYTNRALLNKPFSFNILCSILVENYVSVIL